MMTDFELKLIIAMGVGGLLLMIGLFIHFRYRNELFRKELKEAISDTEGYEAIVQSVDADGNPVLMFRDERKKATVVHKYKSAGMKKYNEGDIEILRYSDAREFSFIADDNIIFKKMFAFTRRMICIELSVPLVVITVSIILLLT
jgi:hypothetical protein